MTKTCPPLRGALGILPAFLLLALCFVFDPTWASAQPLSFPNDEGFHADAEFEMWSLLAHVTSTSGRSIGVGVMFFTGRVVGLKLSGTYHLLADESEAEWVTARDLVVPFFGRSSHTEGRLDETYDRSRLWRDPTTGQIRAEIRTGGSELFLEFDPTLEAVDFGRVAVGDSETQRVYALPAGVVTGRLVRPGDEAVDFSGIGVFQHAWGESPNPDQAGSQFSAHFDDGTALLAYHGEREGSAHSLSVRRPQGDSLVTDAFTAQAFRQMDGQADGAVFPVEWRLRSTDLQADIRFETSTGERAVRILGMPFWVGRCRVSGNLGRQAVLGLGYVLIRGVVEPG